MVGRWSELVHVGNLEDAVEPGVQSIRIGAAEDLCLLVLGDLQAPSGQDLLKGSDHDQGALATQTGALDCLIAGPGEPLILTNRW